MVGQWASRLLLGFGRHLLRHCDTPCSYLPETGAGRIFMASAINGALMIEPTQHLDSDRDPATPTIVHHGGRTTTLLSPPHPCPTWPRLLNSLNYVAVFALY